MILLKNVNNAKKMIKNFANNVKMDMVIEEVIVLNAMMAHLLIEELLACMIALRLKIVQNLEIV